MTMTTKMENLGDAQRRLPAEVYRAVLKVEEAAELPLGHDYPTRATQNHRRDIARENLALAIEAHVRPKVAAVDAPAAALDEARGRIEALERQATIAAETIAQQRAEIARLRRHVADPSLAERANDRAIELLREATRIRRNMTERPYYADVRAARYSRAADRCEAIARHEPAFGGV